MFALYYNRLNQLLLYPILKIAKGAPRTKGNALKVGKEQGHEIELFAILFVRNIDIYFHLCGVDPRQELPALPSPKE